MTALVRKVSKISDPFQDDFRTHAAHLPGAGLVWLDARRARAIDVFAETGMPTRRVEAWKYTDLSSALEAGLEPAKPEAAGSHDILFAGLDAFRIVFVNGFLHSQTAAMPKGLEIVDLARLDGNTPDWVKTHFGQGAAGASQPLGAASLALMRGGVAVRVTGTVETPVALDFLAQSAAASHARVLIVLEKNASLRLLETHTAANAASVANLGMEFLLKPGAMLDHVRVQEGAPEALHVTSLSVSLGRDAKYRAFAAALGGKLSRLDAAIDLTEIGAEASLNSVTVLSAGVGDVTTVMTHASPHTTSRQLFKSVLGGNGRSVAQGRVTVREGALKSDSHQLFKALLLSPRAEADAKPELEIYADDVICGHGTAIGALDADALFYLRARGIPFQEARGLLIRAFLEETLGTIADAAVHDILWRAVEKALLALGEVTP
jgi:Fe-S cluster assembly protein SufD